MPDRIETAQIQRIDTDKLEIDDRYPGTFGFRVYLTTDPGTEWGVEFEAVYEAASYAGKPPVAYGGDHLVIYYLPRYAEDLGKYVNFLSSAIGDTNQAVELRNSILPDEEKEKQEFRSKLREVAARLPAR